MIKKTIPIRALIYSDNGVSQTSLQSILSIFKDKTSILELQTVSSADIINGALKNAQCLIMPGGADIPYCQQLNGSGNQHIREFVASGNLYIGICAGAYYAASAIDFSGDGYYIRGERELSFFDGLAIGSLPTLTNGKYYDEETPTKALANLKFTDAQTEDFYYHGGPFFTDSHKTNNSHIFATYPTGESAVVYGNFGKGQYFLSGVHFEMCPKVYEKLVIANASEANLAQEHTLLRALKNPNYGQLMYDKIDDLFREQFKLK